MKRYLGHTLERETPLGYVRFVCELTYEVTPGEAPTRYYPNSELGNPGTPDRAQLVDVDIREVESDATDTNDISVLPLAQREWWPLKRWIEAALLDSMDPSDAEDLYFYYSQR